MKKYLFMLIVACSLSCVANSQVICDRATTTYKTGFIPKIGNFTMMLQIEANGYTDRKKQEWPNGMVVSYGSGYYEGWRIFLGGRNNYVPFFEIGRPNIGAIALRADYGLTQLRPHHVAVTWSEENNGGYMRIYIDGNMAGEKYVDVVPKDVNRDIVIGYNDFGVGELDAVFSNVVYVDRALDEEEIRASIAEWNGEFTKLLWRKDLSIGEVKEAVYNLRAEKYGLDGKVDEEQYAGFDVDSLRKDYEKLTDSNDVMTIQLEEKDCSISRINEEIDNVKKLRSSGDNRHVRIVLPLGELYVDDTIRLANVSNITLEGAKDSVNVFDSRVPNNKRTALIGYDVIALQEKDIVSESNGLALCKVKVDVAYVFERYGCGSPFGKAPALEISTTQETSPLKMSRYPKKQYIDVKSENGKIKLADDLYNLVKDEKNLFAHGFWRYFWADDGVKISLNHEEKTFAVNDKTSYGVGDYPRFVLMNSKSFLDEELEYYYDGDFLYFLLDKDVLKQGASLRVAKQDKHFIEIKNSKNVVLSNMNFIGSCATILKADNVDGLYLENLDVSLAGSTAFSLYNCKNTLLRYLEMKDIGYGGVRLWSGDRVNNKPHRALIESCRFKNIGLLAKTYAPPVFMEGFGIVVNNCVFTDTPSSAMRIEGSGHIVEHCYFKNNVKESDDQGAIDMWGDFTYRGCIFRYNRFEDVGDGDNQECGRCAIRFDDRISGMFVYGNTFVNAARGNFGAVQIHGGSHNIVFLNKFENCNYGVSFTPRGKEFVEIDNDELRSKNERYKNNALFLNAFPSYNRYKEDYDVNFIFSNHFTNCTKTFREKRDRVEFQGNLVE